MRTLLLVAALAAAPAPDGLIVGAATNAASDGPAAEALVDAKRMVADADGTLYFTEEALVRKLTPDGRVTTIAGGPGAPFRQLFGIARDARGTLYVADGYAIWAVAPGGAVTLAAGDPADQGADPKPVDGPRGKGRFYVSLVDLAAAPDGSVWFTDLHAVRRMAPDGTLTTILPEAKSKLAKPFGLAVGRDGAAIVVDAPITDGPHRLWRVAPDGRATVLAGGLSERKDGKGAQAGFRDLQGVVVDPAGDVVVNDGGVLRRVGPDGTVKTLADTRQADRTAAIAADGRGTYFLGVGVATARIATFGADGRRRLLAGAARKTMDGPAARARFDGIRDVAWLDADTLAVLDERYRTVDAQGRVTTVLDVPRLHPGADPAGVNAFTHFMDVGPGGQVAFTLDNAFALLTPGGALKVVAGKRGEGGSRDGKGAAARLLDATLDARPDGRFWLTETTAEGVQRCRLVGADGAVKTQAFPPKTPWAPAYETRLQDLAIAPDGTAFALETDNTTTVLSAYGPKGSRLVATTDAGRAKKHHGLHMPGLLPGELALDGRGRLYAAVHPTGGPDAAPTHLAVITPGAGFAVRPLPGGVDWTRASTVHLAAGRDKLAVASDTQIAIGSLP